MKKRTIFALNLSFLLLLALVGLGVCLLPDLRNTSGSLETEQSTDASQENTSAQKTPEEGNEKQDKDNKEAIGNSKKNSGRDDGSQEMESSLDEQTAAALRAAQAANAPLPKHHLIFVGDSRTVGMGTAEAKLGDTCTYIGEVGEGYHWFTESGLSQMEDAIAQHPDSPVIVNLGVNDPDQIDRYLELYRSFSESYPDTDFYFMAVNPVTEESTHINNEEIAAFNAQLKAAFPEQYLDCYTYLMMQEFTSPDGVHYSGDTYCMIHDFALRQILGA